MLMSPMGIVNSRHCQRGTMSVGYHARAWKIWKDIWVW